MFDESNQMDVYIILYWHYIYDLKSLQLDYWTNVTINKKFQV